MIRAGGQARYLHELFQRHHLRPDEVLALPVGVRAFLFASLETAAQEAARG